MQINNDEPLIVDLTVDDINATVMVTHIGEVEELEDGSGSFNIEYSTRLVSDVEELPDDFDDKVEEELQRVIMKALTEFVEANSE